MWSIKTGGLWRQVLLCWNVGPSAKNVWSFKTGGLSWQWSLKTGFTVIHNKVTSFGHNVRWAVSGITAPMLWSLHWTRVSLDFSHVHRILAYIRSDQIVTSHVWCYMCVCFQCHSGVQLRGGGGGGVEGPKSSPGHIVGGDGRPGAGGGITGSKLLTCDGYSSGAWIHRQLDVTAHRLEW